jgi:hypothetical protein
VDFPLAFKKSETFAGDPGPPWGCLPLRRRKGRQVVNGPNRGGARGDPGGLGIFERRGVLPPRGLPQRVIFGQSCPTHSTRGAPPNICTRGLIWRGFSLGFQKKIESPGTPGIRQGNCHLLRGNTGAAASCRGWAEDAKSSALKKGCHFPPAGIHFMEIKKIRWGRDLP